MTAPGEVSVPRLVCPGEREQSDERAKRDPLTIRTMREHGTLPANRPNVGLRLTGFTKADLSTPRKGRRPESVS